MKNADKKIYQEKLIIILGPTSSGKSDLAVHLAKKFNGEIISADSRQVYKGMDIGSGKITKKGMRGIPHHLLDVASPKKRFTVSQFQKLARRAIKKIQRKNKLAILCGGTGLYIQSIIDGLVIPEVPPDAKLRVKLEKLNTEKLFAKLQKLDPRRAQNIDRHNRRRLIRALEIIIKTGKPVPINQFENCSHIDFSVIPARFAIAPARRAQAGIQKQIIFRQNKMLDPRFPASPAGGRKDNNSINILQLGIAQPKEKLKALIKKRLLKRLKQGIVAEVLKLHKQGVSWKRLEEFGLEYRAVAQYLQKKIAKREMIAKIQKESEQYAKRQMTWFKRDKRIKWVKSYKETENSTRQFFS